MPVAYFVTLEEHGEDTKTGHVIQPEDAKSFQMITGSPEHLQDPDGNGETLQTIVFNLQDPKNYSSVQGQSVDADGANGEIVWMMRDPDVSAPRKFERIPNKHPYSFRDFETFGWGGRVQHTPSAVGPRSQALSIRIKSLTK
mmetsp:Transcript_24112/g.32972  ORF Transcript_24112/g.32972 Transcript_24112/m.32972 type:complete len:142 (+) Transcript_24112:524-949(+)